VFLAVFAVPSCVVWIRILAKITSTAGDG
jgi:hypothetical protein